MIGVEEILAVIARGLEASRESSPVQFCRECARRPAKRAEEGAVDADIVVFDMVALDRDPLASPPEALKEIRVMATVLGGRVHDTE